MDIRNFPKILILFQTSRATLCRQPYSTTTAAGTKRTCRGRVTMSAPEGKTDAPREPGTSVFDLSGPSQLGLSLCRNTFPRCSNSAEGDLFQASHSQCTRCSGRQVYAASLYEWTAVIDSDSDASSA